MIQENFSRFINSHLDENKPLLLALSGGPDSLLLFTLLLENKIKFEVAHVNHKWRKESDEEALFLKKMVEDQGIKFHELSLLPPCEQKDLENKGREARLGFFQSLVSTYGYQAVMLGHHADDQAETVLKRVFEGASLYHLKGLKAVSSFKGMILWRPLIEIRKQEILSYLEQRNITPFFDATNKDPKFLRGRLREEILPYLSTQFGKEITSSLCRLAHSSLELHEFVEELLISYRERVEKKGDSISLNFNYLFPKTTFEWKCIVRDFFGNQGVSISTFALESIIEHLKRGNVHKEMVIGKTKVRVHRKELIIS